MVSGNGMENGNESAVMTGDELAAELYRQQGFIVMASSGKVPIGYVIRPEQCIDAEIIKHSCALRIIGIATKREFTQQRLLSEKLLPGSTTDRHATYFWRCEALD